MKPEYPLPVRYVLYTHYHEANDWKNMTRETSLLIVQVVRFLSRVR